MSWRPSLGVGEITVWPAATFWQYIFVHLELPVTQVDFLALTGLFMRSEIHVLDASHLIKARSWTVLVWKNTEVIPSSSRIRSMAALFPTLETSRVAWSITVCICSRYIPLAIYDIAQVGVVVSSSGGLQLQCHFDYIITIDGHDRALGCIQCHFPSV
ncbi:hypothetical protein AYI69_g9919 [Smittium culicis]|uniref:Uncharacterized protein n=1 Tax=Smittium culicis TaxID=133412 RepID=A0A1R1X988_9FUNG|nr:hypothetical protein AYI69_g9919 [Smittium culicis]